METKTKKNSAKEKSETLSEQIEGLKAKLDEATENAKQTIRSIIDSCTESYNKAIEANKKYVEELRDHLKDSNVDTSVYDEITSTFVTSLEVSDEVIDAIIDSHLRRVHQVVDFNKKCIESLKEAYLNDNPDFDSLLDLFKKNFEQTIELSTRDMRKIVDVYNRHINLSLNFNKRFSKNINSQVDSLIKLQAKGLQAYSNWISNWWKEDK
ncbi:MAG: hypothetical protein HYY40_01505 [Bacteroidetes bacterium]|nr:hypothetical protein [Bacteroidota bacterium]